MKIPAPASSNLFRFCLFLGCVLLAACDTLGLPDWSRHDEVPDSAKAAPRLVETPPPLTGKEPWPQLGDVPFKPKDFSPKPVYNHYLNELEYDRAIGDDALNRTNGDTGGDTLPTTIPAPPAKPIPGLAAPQMPKE